MWLLTPKISGITITPPRGLPAGAATYAASLGAAALDAFCDALWLEDGLSKNTLSSYRRDLGQFASFLKKTSLEKASEADLFGFLAARKGRASSAARMLSSLKRFYGWCLDRKS